MCRLRQTNVCAVIVCGWMISAGCQSMLESTTSTDLASEFTIQGAAKSDETPEQWRFSLMRGEDPAGDEFTFEWSIDGGPVMTGAEIDFDFDSPGTFRVSVTALRADGTVAFTISRDFEVRMTLNLTLNNPPNADAGADLSVSAGDSVSLDASESSDEDGDELSFSWEQVSGPEVMLQDADTAVASFIAPNEANVSLGFRVLVSDGDLSNEDDVEVQVAAPLNTASTLCPISFDVLNDDGENIVEETIPFSVDLVVLSTSGDGELPDGEYTWVIDGVEDSGSANTHGRLSRVISTAGAHTVALIVTLAGATGPLGCERSQDGQAEVTFDAKSATTPSPGAPPSGCSTDADCANGDLCDGQETCVAGTCTPGAALDCDDANPCTDDSCNASSGCVNTSDDSNACDDANPCNGNETCASGVCQSSSPLDCDDNNPCTDDSCDASSGCVNTNDDSNGCDDGLFCNGAEACSAGSCQSAGDPCAGDICVESTDQCVACNVHADCDDGAFCNGDERCVSNACVAGTPRCPGLTCDEPSDSCIGCSVDADCDNGDVCDGVETCSGGICQLGAVLSCNDGNPCTDDTCDPTGGCSNVADDSNICSDGNACNGTESCQAGACATTGPLNCNDNNVCTTDTCHAVFGCVNSADNSASCDDGDACNGQETCVAGSCQSGASPNCNDGNPCTDDSCNSGSGCVNVVDDSNSCNDGAFCNGTESCSAGSCQSTGSPCAAGESCNESTDMCIVPSANTIYVDDNGSQQPGWDASAPAGSINHPYIHIQAGANVAAPGDTVSIRAGTYTAPTGGYSTPVLDIVTGGAAGAPIRFENFGNEKVILDAEAVLSNSNNGHRRGISIPGSSNYIELSGLVVRNAHREGIMVNSDHVTIEDCIVEHCGLNPNNGESVGIKFNFSKFFAARRCVARYCYSGIVSKGAQDGVYEDCMAYNCGFMSTGTPIYPENADGLGTTAARNGSDRVRIIRGISFANGDDQISLGHSRDCSAESCIAFNGNIQNSPNGDGNGFKVGNDQNEAVGSGHECRRLLVRNCLAFANKANGIDARDGIDGFFYNNTAYGTRGQFGYSAGSSGHRGYHYNNISWGNLQSDLFEGGNLKQGDYNNWADNGGNQMPAGDAHSIRANPGFANPDAAIDTSWQGGFAIDDVRGILPTVTYIHNQARANFALTNSNPSTTSIDRGTFITFTSSGGSGTNISVTDSATARFRVGDVIKVEGAGNATIVAIASNAITVNTALTFSAGAGVHLSYSGNSPDIGAIESP